MLSIRPASSSKSGSFRKVGSIRADPPGSGLPMVHHFSISVTPVSKFEESLSSDSETDPNSDESPAKEVLELRERQQKGHFASSLKPRSDRSEKIKFRVGQVVQHIKNGYRGVVVGWDPQANAPNDWLKQSGEENQDWMHQPNYLILVDTRDRPEPQFTYVPQDNLKIKKHARVIHPKLYDYFKDYDGAQYVPRLWLQIIYPKD